MALTTLLNTPDSFELIRDKLSSLLALEFANQVRLAAAAGVDPDKYRLRVYQERTAPWQEFFEEGADTSPLVNVWWDSSTFDKSTGNVVMSQKNSVTYNIDCYGYGIAADNPAGGHIVGDQAAAEAVQRAARMVRQVIMAAENTYLGMRGTVWGRWIDSVQSLQVRAEAPNVQAVVAARVRVTVEATEVSPQTATETLELMALSVTRHPDGLVLAVANIDYT
jgi:hypothetical protein